MKETRSKTKENVKINVKFNVLTLNMEFISLMRQDFLTIKILIDRIGLFYNNNNTVSLVK